SSSSTYDHRTLKTRLPVRSAIFKQRTGGLVVRWVTTGESPLLYVFAIFLPCFYMVHGQKSYSDLRVDHVVGICYVCWQSVKQTPQQCFKVSRLLSFIFALGRFREASIPPIEVNDLATSYLQRECGRTGCIKHLCHCEGGILCFIRRRAYRTACRTVYAV
ncbi:hypothetical protein EJ07DRAFT_97427, partial [Lizonia empirigonia]